MLESHELLATRNYKVMILLRKPGIWTSSLAILNTNAVYIVIIEYLVWPIGSCSRVEQMEAGRFWSASNAPMNFKRVINIKVQMEQLRKKIGFLVVICLTIKVSLGSTVI